MDPATSTKPDIQHAETQPSCHQPDNLWINSTDMYQFLLMPRSASVANPCGMLLLLVVSSIIHLSRVNATPLGHSPLNVTKTALSLILCLLSVFEASRAHSGTTHVPSVSTSLSTVYGLHAANMFVAGVVQQLGRHSGWRSCGPLTIYWLLSSLGHVTIYWSYLKQDGYKSLSMGTAEVHNALVMVQLVLSFMGDTNPVIKSDSDEGTAVENEEAKASIIEVMTYGWFTKFVIKAFKAQIKKEEMYPLMKQDQCSEVVPKFECHFDAEIQRSLSSRQSKKTSETKMDTDVDRKAKEKYIYMPNLVKSLFKAYGFKWGVACLIGIVEDCSVFLKPFLLKELMTFINKTEEPAWKGLALAVGLYLATCTNSLLKQQYMRHAKNVGTNIRSAIVAAIYKKALRLSNAARQKTSVGEVVNLMSCDAGRFEDRCFQVPMLWSAPIQILLSLYLLWTLLGASTLAGIAVMITLIPINKILHLKVLTLYEATSNVQDERVKAMNEVLNGIKVLKLYAWEKSFYEKVLSIRNKELDHRKARRQYDNVFSSFLSSCSSNMRRAAGLCDASDDVTIAKMQQVFLSTFAVYVLLSPGNVLDAEKIFVSMYLFRLLQEPLGNATKVVADLSELSVSIKRLQEYFSNEELDETNVVYITTGDDSLRIEDGTFSWNNADDKPTLKNVNIRIKEGSLVAVVGAVGCGKSSLLSALLGEMNKTNGTVKVKGSIAYVPQQAWIQNATLKDNILFHSEVNNRDYKKVVEACALTHDFDILPAGDQTEIGEKGVNLSGGQKQRVSLARAVSSDKDIYLLDDPLSAVDAHVGKHIFDKVIGPEGLLKEKTRVLVTHGISPLPFVDHIIVMKDGVISEIKSYTELLTLGRAFADLLITHAREKSVNLECRDEMKRRCEPAKGEIIEKAQKLTKNGKVISRSGSKLNGKLIKEETKETRQVKFQSLLFYIQYFGVWIGLLLGLCKILERLTDMSSNLWLGDWTKDATNSTQHSVSQGHFKLAVYGLISLIKVALICASATVRTIGSHRVSGRIHARLLMNVLRTPMSFFDTTPLGQIVSRFTKDIQSLDNDIPFCFDEVLKCICTFVIGFSTIAYSTPAIVLAMLPFAALYLFIQRFYCATNRQLAWFVSASSSPIFSHFSESIQGAQTIRAYGQVPRFIKQSQEYIDFHHKCKYNDFSSQRWLSIRVEGIGNLMVLFIGLFAIFSRHHLSSGIVGISIVYALHLTDILYWFVLVVSRLENEMVSIERICEYSMMETEAPWVVETKRPAENWPQCGDVTFEKYSTRYREGLELVLKDINCKVHSGERVGIVGRTGAGKSSLTLGLFRIIEPAGGKITIDGINISELGLHDLRSKITIIPQDPVLFCGTFRMNLDPFDTFTNEDLWTALEHAHLKVFVEALPSGLDHEVAEGGENLSVGQRQQLCVARALLQKTKLLVLDEATAAVDLDTDALIQNTIRTKFSDCTVFTIAHRLNTIMDYTKIMVFENGHIKEFATPDELLRNQSSLFYSMAKDAGLVDKT